MVKKYINIQICYNTNSEADLLKLKLIKSLINNDLYAIDLIYFNTLKNQLLNKELWGED